MWVELLMSIQCPSKGPKLAGNPCQGIGGKIGRENHTCDGRTVTSFNVAPANWKFKVRAPVSYVRATMINTNAEITT